MYILSIRFTTKYVSPALQQTELEAVGKTTTTHGNMEVSHPHLKLGTYNVCLRATHSANEPANESESFFRQRVRERESERERERV